MSEQSLQFEEVVALALRLSPVEKTRLIERVATTLERELTTETPPKPRRSLYGLLAHLGTAPSEEDIDDVRREMWSNFPREDI